MATAALSGVSPSAAGDTGADPSGPSATQTVTFSDLVEVSRQHQMVTTTDPQTGQPSTGMGIAAEYVLPSQLTCKVFYTAKGPIRELQPPHTPVVDAESRVHVGSACHDAVGWQPVLSYFEAPPRRYVQRDQGQFHVTLPGTSDAGFVLAYCDGYTVRSWKHHILYGGAAATARLDCG